MHRLPLVLVELESIRPPSSLKQKRALCWSVKCNALTRYFNPFPAPGISCFCDFHGIN